MEKITIFDGQLFQTGAWDRGMGKYTFQLLIEYSKLVPENHKVIILLNTNLPIVEARIAALKKHVKNLTIVEAELTLPDEYHTNETDYVADLNDAIKHNFGAISFNYVMTALFLFDFYSAYPAGARKITIFYDFTPVICWEDLKQFFPAHLYMKRFTKLFESDLICTISETVKNDVITLLGLPSTRINNIDGGYTNLQLVAAKPNSFVPPQKYILFPTGDLPHKNNDFAVMAFEKASINKEIKLLITSNFSEASIERLERYSKNLVFTGNVSDKELVWLYENTEAVLFSSKYEGLGIPILDALIHEKPVIASNIPVFKEMAEDSFYFFELTSESNLSSSIEQGISRKDFANKRKNYRKIIEKYTWANTAKKFIAVEKKLKKNNYKTNNKSESFAVVSANPAFDSVSRLLEECNYRLQKKYNISYFFDSRGVSPSNLGRPTFLDYVSSVSDIKKLTATEYTRFNKIVYILELDDLTKLAGIWSIILPGTVLLSADRKVNRQEKIAINALSQLNRIVVNTKVKNSQNLEKIISALMDEAILSKDELFYRNSITPSTTDKEAINIISKNIQHA